MPCLKRGMATVRQVVVEGKLGCSRPQGEIHRVVSGLAGHGDRGNHDTHLLWTCGEDRINLGTCRQIYFECALTRLCQRRAGLVLDLDHVGNVKQVSNGSGAENFDSAGYALHMGRCVEHLDSESLTCGSLLIIADALMKHAHQVWFVRILNIEGKRPL